MAVYVAGFSFMVMRRHQAYSVGEWDTGIFAQSFWTAAFASLPFYNTYEGHSHFAYHNSPILFLLLPLYRLVPTVETLLVAQTVAIALGAIPVFLLARDRVGPRTGLVLGALWLLNFPLHGVNWHDFHETGLGGSAAGPGAVGSAGGATQARLGGRRAGDAHPGGHGDRGGRPGPPGSVPGSHSRARRARVPAPRGLPGPGDLGRSVDVAFRRG